MTSTPFHSPSLSWACVFLHSWLVICLSSLWRQHRLLIKDRSPPQQRALCPDWINYLPLLLFLYFFLPLFFSLLPYVFFSLLASEEICALAMFFPCDHRMLWNRLVEEKKGGSERINERETVMREQVTEVTSVSRGSGDAGGGVTLTNKLHVSTLPVVTKQISQPAQCCYC